MGPARRKDIQAVNRRKKGAWRGLVAITGVSQSTISRVFNNDSRISAAVRQQVLTAAQNLGYRPRVVARRPVAAILLETGHSLLVEGYDNILLVYLTKYLIERKIAYEILPTNEIETLASRSVDGVLSMVYRPENLKRLSVLRRLPLLHVNKNYGLPSIMSDNVQGTELATDYLWRHGHRRIGLVVFFTDGRGVCGERIKGYHQVLQQRRIPADPQLIQGLSDQTVLQAVLQICRHKATALIIGGEYQGVQGLHELLMLGKRIPDDISVITYEWPGLSRYLWPPCTTVAQDFDRLGDLTVQCMEAMMNGQKVPRTCVRLPHRLIERESVRVLKTH